MSWEESAWRAIDRAKEAERLLRPCCPWDDAAPWRSESCGGKVADSLAVILRRLIVVAGKALSQKRPGSIAELAGVVEHWARVNGE